MRRRLALAWRVLRGKSVMYRCVLAHEPYEPRVFLAGKSGDVMVTENAMFERFVGDGEIVVFDFGRGMAYPLQFSAPPTD